MNITPTAPGFRPGFYVIDSRRLVDHSRHQMPDAAIKRAAQLSALFNRTFHVMARYQSGDAAVCVYTAGNASGVAESLLTMLSA